MFFEKLETRRMFATTIVNSSAALPKIPPVVITRPQLTAEPSATSQLENALQGTPDPAKLNGPATTVLPGGMNISLDPAQRAGVGDFAGTNLGSLLGDSFLQDLIARFGESTSQLTDLAGSATSASAGSELIDILGADLASMRAIYEQSKGDRTSQASQGNAQTELDRILADALAQRRQNSSGNPNGDEHLDEGDGADDDEGQTDGDDSTPSGTDDADDNDEDTGFFDVIVDFFADLFGGGEDSSETNVGTPTGRRGTPDPNSDDVTLTPQQQQAINQLWALASKYIVNPPRALDQGTGLISQPPDGETIINKPDKSQLPGPDALRNSRLAPYINPGSGDDGSGTASGSGTVTEAPKPRPGVVDDFGQKYGTITNLAPSGSNTPSNPGGGTTTGGGASSDSQQP